jgi:hypothetical protein
MKISARCAAIWSVRSAVRGDGKEPWYRPPYVVVKDGNRLPEEEKAMVGVPVATLLPRLLDRVALAADRELRRIDGSGTSCACADADREQVLAGLPACGAPARDRANRGGR